MSMKPPYLSLVSVFCCAALVSCSGAKEPAGTIGTAESALVNDCTTPPNFQGVTTLSQSGSPTCTFVLTWAPAGEFCGGTITYSVYRSKQPTFTPSIANRIATGVTGTSFADDLNLVSGSGYFYIVRASEAATAVVEETNTVTKGASVIGSCTTNTPPPGPAVKYTLTVPPVAVEAGHDFAISATAEDAVDQQATGYSGSATLTIPGGTQSLTFTNGAVSSAIVTINKAGTASLTLTDTGNPAITGRANVTVLAGPGTHLGFVSPPANAVAGTVLAPVTVQIQDAYGNAVPTGTPSISLSLDANLAGATLAGTTDATATDGVATFSDLVVNKAGTGYKLVASAPGFSSATSAAFNVTPADATKLVFTSHPSDATAGESLGNVQLTFLDAFNNQAASNANVTVAIASGPGTALGGSTTVAAVNGVATFPDLTVTKSGTYTLSAVSGAITSTESNSFNITAAAPHHLTFKTQPGAGKVGLALSPAPQVEVRDVYDNAHPTATTEITIALDTNASNAALFGTTTVNAAGGVATFGDLQVNRPGNDYTLTASATGLVSATSSAFNVAVGDPATFKVLQTPTLPITAGSDFAIQVAVVDVAGNVVESATPVITLSYAGGNTVPISGSAMVTAMSGLALFSPFTITTVGNYTLTLSAPNLTPISLTNVLVLPAAAHALKVLGQPSTTAAGEAISPAVTVAVVDTYDNVVIDSAASVTVALGQNPSSAPLEGTLTVVAEDGVATFSDLSVEKATPGYTLAFSSTGVKGTESNSFEITAGAASRFLVTLPANVVAGEDVMLIAKALDSFDNLASDFDGTVAITSSDTRAILPANAAFSQGLFGPTKLTFRTAGTTTVTVTSVADAQVKGTATTKVAPFPKPTVQVTSPAANAVVEGTVDVTATAEVATGATLLNLTLFVDGQELGSGTASPLTKTWNVSALADGSSHTITAEVTDSEGNAINSTPVTVTVKAATVDPAPNNGGGAKTSSGCGCSSGQNSTAGILPMLLAAMFIVRLRGMSRKMRA